MRWKFFLAVAIAMTITVAVAGYAATPLRAAWVLSEAVRNGDQSTIERKVKWESVRSSLKDSLAEHPLLLKKATAAGEELRPTLWQRVKSVMGATMLDRFIETYVSPEGLSLLAQVRNEKVDGAPAVAKLGYVERVVRLVARMKRIHFSSPTRVEIEVADEDIPERRYAVTWELQDSEWKLASFRVVAIEDDGSLLARH